MNHMCVYLLKEYNVQDASSVYYKFKMHELSTRCYVVEILCYII